MKFKESTLKLYAAPLSRTEDEKCKHAIEQIRDALKNLGYTDDDKGIGLLESDTLAYSVSMRGMYSKEKIHIFIQGSYANNTCVRNESDVDIAIVREDDHDSAYGENMRIVTANKKIEAMKLKDNVERTLKIKFPNNQVHRKNKSIKVDGNTYRKQVDTVPCIAMNYYYRSHLYDNVSYHDGVIIFADDGTIIRNFPKQHITKGKAKNSSTNYYYKKMVRIMKKMRYLMIALGYINENEVSSFGVESMVWNIPDCYFTRYQSYGYIFEDILGYLYRNKTMINEFYEANGIKKLCNSQDDMKKYTNFINKLYSFFEYDYL